MIICFAVQNYNFFRYYHDWMTKNTMKNLFK